MRFNGVYMKYSRPIGKIAKCPFNGFSDCRGDDCALAIKHDFTSEKGKPEQYTVVCAISFGAIITPSGGECVQASTYETRVMI